jgi:LPXTG-site transpeptidase (sortase) family protein
MNIKLLKKSVYLKLFFSYFLAIFIVFGALLYFFDLMPNEFVSRENSNSESKNPTLIQEEASVNNVLPARITISSVGIDTTVNHPSSQNVEVLDQALLSGSVYYPGSGSIGNGNMFVFGHSTGLTIVKNQAFKAFNNLKNVVAGDEIRVFGDDGNVYIYTAISLELVNDDSSLVEFDTTEKMITLSTCNTFGKKEERHVVKAKFTRQEVKN